MVPEQIKPAIDVAAISTGFASLIGWLPAVAAALTVIWTLIRIYETRTVQRFLYGKTDNEF